MICFDQFACFLLIEVKKRQCICMLCVDKFACFILIHLHDLIA